MKVGSFLVVMIFPVILHAQDTLALKGIVVNKVGEPLVGCNVIIKGTTIGRSTDVCGEFSIPIKTDFTILFHAMSYEDLRTFEMRMERKEVRNEKIIFQIGSGTEKNKECTNTIPRNLKKYRIK